jgi:PBSX family phage terminase large subunit
MKVGSKYRAFLREFDAGMEFLEGTTQAGKTTVGLVKFMLKVAESPRRSHIIAALDKGVIEKNLINKDHGIAEMFGPYIRYNGNGTGNESIPHLVFRPDGGPEKVIYCLGYDKRDRWQKALGGQYGCVFVDEINVADIDFVRETAMRCDYMMATLNPDDPALPVYGEYINHSRPLPEWAGGTPEGILKELREKPVPGWVHWFFSMDDNVALTPEKRAQTIRNVPEGTKLWKNKILGLRGRATGLVFSNFSDENVLSEEDIKRRIKTREIAFKRLVMGVDTAYSTKSPDTISMIMCGVTHDGAVYVLDERTYNNAVLRTPLAPSDVVRELVGFADACRVKWGPFRAIFIDSADQATITECMKYKREQGSVYIFAPAYKETKILDRINLQLGWIAKGQYIVNASCREHLRELGVYSWQDDKPIPEDGNDHTINASQYAWMPYVNEIGTERA